MMALSLGLTASVWGQGSFCGAVGTPRCNAVHCDSSAIIGWATGCTVVRGPVDIVNPDGPHVRFGEEEYGIGPAGTITTHAVSLGDGGTATLTFGAPIHNVPGPDFAVYENSFNDNFLELAFVEVSSDGEHFVRFPATSLTQTETQVGSNGSVDPTNLNNLAGKFRIGYGTPFDLEELRDSVGLDIDNITHVRLVDVVGTIDPQYATYDAFGHIVNDPYPTNEYANYASGGFDLTGVAVLTALQGIEDSQLSTLNSQLVVYPNPVTDYLFVTLLRPAKAILVDTKGHAVTCYHLRQGRNTLDLTNLSSGVYMLRCEDLVNKIVKK